MNTSNLCVSAASSLRVDQLAASAFSSDTDSRVSVGGSLTLFDQLEQESRDLVLVPLLSRRGESSLDQTAPGVSTDCLTGSQSTRVPSAVDAANSWSLPPAGPRGATET